MITLPCKITSLVTKHNFSAERVDYYLELVLLGKKFTLPVSEDFVARLDSSLEGPAEERPHRPHAQQSAPTLPEGFEIDPSVGDLERDADTYTDEEIALL